MSRSDWVRVSIAGALVAVAIIGVGVWLSKAYEFKQVDQHQSVAPGTPYHAHDQEQDTCAHITSLSQYRNCLGEQAKAARAEQREQYDLEAQHDMALWAFTLFLSGLLGLGITGAGVIYVALTLRATRDAVRAAHRQADEARRIGEAQVRAYVTVREVQMSMRDGQRYPTVSFEVGNAGNSPALEVTPSASVRFRIPEGKDIGDFDGATGVLLGH